MASILSMWSMAGMTVVRLGVPREKKRVVSLKIYSKMLETGKIQENQDIPSTRHKVLQRSSILKKPIHICVDQDHVNGWVVLDGELEHVVG